METPVVAHGYTLGELRGMARAAYRIAWRRYGLTHIDGFDVAFSAIGEALAATETMPQPEELIKTGIAAVVADGAEIDRLHGQRRGRTTPRFAGYWLGDRQHDPIDELVERLAVHQILEVLTERQRMVVEALAGFDDYDRAARSVGLNRNAFNERLRNARARLYNAWFYPDPPPPAGIYDGRKGSKFPRTHCSAGHELTPDNMYLRSEGRRVCRTCKRGEDRARTRKVAV